MKKLDLILNIVMLVMGVLGIVSFGILAAHGQAAGMRIVALLLAIAMTAVGALGLAGARKNARDAKRKAARKAGKEK